MGCGKSTAAAFFVEEGFRSLDTDGIAHQLLACDPQVRAAIRTRFGPTVFADSGEIDRSRLGTLVFSDTEALAWLEALLHPRVRAIWQREVANQPNQAWVIQIPLLFEKKLEELVDLTVCVGASSVIQLQRLLRRGSSEYDLTRRIARQLPTEEKAAKADFFLLNDGSPDFLRAQVKYLCGRLVAVY
jgi:dephospho-CoA kinase